MNGLEKEIMEQIQKGDKQAFSQLYELYADYALRVAYGVTKQKELAADAVQETFIRVYRNAPSFDTDKPFKPWFYRILLNECNRLLKKEKKVISIEEYIAHLPSEEVEEWFEYEDLHEALDALDEHNRVPILLKYLHDFSEKEIAETLDVNVNTIKSRLLKGRQKLKNSMSSFLKGGNDNE